MSVKKARKKHTPENTLQLFLISIAAAFSLFIILLSLSSVLMLYVNIASEFLFLFILGISFLSVFAASLYVSRKSSSSRFVKGMIVTLILTVTVFLLIISFNNVNVSYKAYLIIPLCIIAGFIGSVAGTNKKSVR